VSDRRRLVESAPPLIQASSDSVLSNTHYRGTFNVMRYTAVREIKRFVELGYLQTAGERRGARYLPGPSLRGGQT
jgi:hypothetical protein